MWRIRSGTRFEVTTDEVTTGSVAQSTAPSRKASAQVRSGKSSFAPSASSARVIGIAITSARAGGPQWRAEQLALDQQPVGDQGEDQRQLDQLDDPGVADVDRDHVELGEHDPEHDREHRGREHRAPHQPGERRRDREQAAEDQQCFAEGDVHQRTYQST